MAHEVLQNTIAALKLFHSKAKMTCISLDELCKILLRKVNDRMNMLVLNNQLLFE